ncbi:telomeric repeat-binding factor 2-interacting protein 1 [Cyprinodon tularosa]|uniref:telomeric repeat-binding factor 2-interacting protein 1 n=1 Tax=Cyprinodon tularosa TaxID=77115 RepID=UPI0018E2202D|nr:telomeric repeat-binding factor 2-interacting protein 1 [Cyprinodon tularosa]XP_038163785.1 telomeric repeat-binding factor 2-interacting protein 1 [Cyprinodon tularosa]XP_038163786.1 telomeric repeat-binding factor 2-interacting protein 1 [Cyprinodon tularosa]
MSSKQPISPVLFWTVEGEPMTFFLRPGPVKRQLQPLITSGGGILSKVQKPGAILLIDPDEKTSISASDAHRYVSTQYIHDCIEKEEQLNLEDYRLNPEVTNRVSPRLNRSGGSPSGLTGRVAYTPEDDAAILNFINQRKGETGGNRLWQEMEKQQVTSHSWQSMKSRYRDRLAKKQPGVIETEMGEETDKLPENEKEVKCIQEFDAEKNSCEATVTPASADSDLTQIEEQSVAAASTSHNAETKKPAYFGVEENRTTEEKQKINIHSESVEGETSHCRITEEQTDNQASTEIPEAEREASPTPVLPKSPPPAQQKSSSKTSSTKRPKKKQEPSPLQEQPRRRLTRRQLDLEASSSSPESYVKKLRSSSSTAEQSTPSPPPLRKRKYAEKSSNQRAQPREETLQKKARGRKAAAVVESDEEQDSHDAEDKSAQADEPNSAPHKATKKKEKRQLGILEMATKEFEDGSESDKDEDSVLLNNDGTTSSAGALEPSDPTPHQPGAESPPESSGSSPQRTVPESQVSSSNSVPNNSCPDAGPSRPIRASSKAHLFIFDSESQQDDSQSVVGESLAAPSHSSSSKDKDATFSLTQVQLEEDKQRIRELMNQTNRDLVSVTKALLKTSGDFASAVDLLLNLSFVSAPLWNRHDDGLLHSTDPTVRRMLQEKYGEESLAKRIAFLEVEG